MMSDYEPASGWNLPPGVTPDDIDARFGIIADDEVPVMCGTCRFYDDGYCEEFECDTFDDEDCTRWEIL